MWRQVLFITVLAAAASGCATISLDQPVEPSYAITDTSDTTLGREVAEWTSQHDGLSGFYPLISGLDAFGARLALIESAEKSIDAQYFLIKPDVAGHIFAGALLQAADRGVRVRFLLDDVFTTADDVDLLALNRHPNIDIRLFNPIARSGSSSLNFLGDFGRANRRMHNKSLTVDNQVTIIGGRNIAEEYFELKAAGEFLDFDVLGLGDVAGDVAEQFDLFWNHEYSIPLDIVASKTDESEVDAARADIAADFDEKLQSIYASAVGSQLVRDLYNDKVPLYPASADFVTDAPDKLTNDVDESQQILVNHLAEVAASAEREIIVITPYFVPLDAGVAFWKAIVDSGVKVTILTNSLASNNHVAVHSGYAKYRRPIIEAGVNLYELRADAVSQPASDAQAPPETVTLHTKAVIIDREFLYVGSLNLDPRSIDVNTEMGAVIRSADLVGPLAERAATVLPERAYRVELDENGKLRWSAVIDGVEVIETREPLTSGWRRFQAFILKIVPDSQL
jgi:putative cardiolipin synthase